MNIKEASNECSMTEKESLESLIGMYDEIASRITDHSNKFGLYVTESDLTGVFMSLNQFNKRLKERIEVIGND